MSSSTAAKGKNFRQRNSALWSKTPSLAKAYVVCYPCRIHRMLTLRPDPGNGDDLDKLTLPRILSKVELRYYRRNRGRSRQSILGMNPIYMAARVDTDFGVLLMFCTAAQELFRDCASSHDHSRKIDHAHFD